MVRPGQRGIRLLSSAVTHVGRVRHNNEDNVHLWGDDNYVLAIVADGMGGAAAGEEASRIAVETVQQHMINGVYTNPHDYEDIEEYDLAEKLETAVREANLNILKRAVMRPEFRGMGTTLTMAFTRHTNVILAHVGDSRAYMVDGHDGHISQITTDHSFVQALVDAGHITPDEAENHPMGNVLYRALGQSADLDIDLIQDVRLQVGDRMILCSDGLTLHIKPPEIASIAMSSTDPNTISQQLIDLANARGGKDNISVIVILVGEDGANKVLDAAEAELEMTLQETKDPTLPTSSTHPATLHAYTASARKFSYGVWHSFNTTYGEGQDTYEPPQ
jgi:protein phosphatase